MSFVIGVIPKFLWGFLREFLFWDIRLTDVVSVENNFLFELKFCNWCRGLFFVLMFVCKSR